MLTIALTSAPQRCHTCTLLALVCAGNVLVVLLATSVHGYSASTLGSLFSAFALVDLLLIYPAASISDRVSDSRMVVVPALCLQAAALVAMSFTVRMSGSRSFPFSTATVA